MVPITEKEFWQLSDYIKAHYGINLKEEKLSLVTGRLQKVLAANNMSSFSEFYKLILSDKTGNAAVNLINSITTNHTFFMRESEHFNFFKAKVLPDLVDNVRGNDLRIWSAGCSSGEEPYTLAMIIDEQLGANKKNWDAKILATDISSKVLEAAVRGMYDHERLATLPACWKMNYFIKYNGEQYIVSDKIRNEVIYRKFNLMEEVFPFKKKFHVIFCRNVMIYFDNETKARLVEKFYDLTEPGGYLFIGHSESLGRDNTRYKYVMPAVYRKQ